MKSYAATVDSNGTYEDMVKVIEFAEANNVQIKVYSVTESTEYGTRVHGFGQTPDNFITFAKQNNDK